MAGRILIIDDVPTHRIVLRAALTAACYDVLLAGDEREALAAFREYAPQIVLIAGRLGAFATTRLCRRIRAQPDIPSCPILVYGVAETEVDRIAALQAGADDIVPFPGQEAWMLARIRTALRAQQVRTDLCRPGAQHGLAGFAEGNGGYQVRGRVALVADRPGTALGWRNVLAATLSDRIDIVPPGEVLRVAGGSSPPDLYLIEIAIGGNRGGLRLLPDLRGRPASRHAAVTMATSPDDPEATVAALDLGADDLLPTDASPAELAFRIRVSLRCKLEADRLRARMETELRMAVTDPLTGLYNRRHALPQLDRIAAQAGVTGQRFAVLAIDIDRFKAVNDRFGHPSGDIVLCAVAERLRSILGTPDLVARMGGEEFLAILPDAGPVEALALGERLCHAMRSQAVDLPHGGPVGVTVSIGIAIGGEGFDAVETLLQRADTALYRAKAEGRDRVMLSRPAAA